MAMKSMIILLLTLLAVVFVAPQANAQLVTVRINGTVLCSLTGSIVNTTTPTLPFPNALVQLTILGVPILPTTTTDSQGRFNLTIVQSLLTSIANLVSVARINILTPLTACNPTLPANNFLQSTSPLPLLNRTLSTISLTVGGFQLVRI